MNYINYISFIVMIASNHFLKSKVKNSKRWYLLGRTSRGFYDVDLHFIVVILHLSSFVDVFHFVVASSFDFQATLPCHRHSTLASQACEDLHQLWSLPQLLLIAFSFSSTASATVLSGHFFTHWRFLPYAPSQHFWHIPDILAQPAFIKVSLGASSYFLESCRASYWSLKHRPGLSVCLIHSNPQSFIHLKSVFMHVNIAKVLLVVKTLIRSAATLFSSHENIKQQPN